MKTWIVNSAIEMSESKERKIGLNGLTNKGQGEGKGQFNLQSAPTTTTDRRSFGAKSCESPVAKLPPEMLEIIFKKVESPKDLLSCWNTASSWAIALRSTDFYFKMTLPFLLPYLSREDLLECGLVSKRWCAAVDTCIQYLEEFGSINRLKSDQRIVFKLSVYTLSLFINSFGLSKNNEPGEKVVVASQIAFRRFRIWLVFPPMKPLCVPLSNYWRNLFKNLEHYGYLIRHLTLNITGVTAYHVENIKLIKSCLERTPNLRVLHIDTPSWGVDNLIDEDLPTVKGNLEALNSERPWPILKHLKVLKFHKDTVRKGYAMIANAYAPQLLYLKFSHQLRESIQPESGRFSYLQKMVCV